MKWLPFITLSLTAMVAQTIARELAVFSIWPDCIFILAVHYALWAPWPDAAIAPLILGLLLGTGSTEQLGLHAFCYGAAAWGIVQIRQVLFRDHVVTQFVITLLSAFCVQLMVWLLRYWSGLEWPGWKGIVAPAFFTAVY